MASKPENAAASKGDPHDPTAQDVLSGFHENRSDEPVVPAPSDPVTRFPASKRRQIVQRACIAVALVIVTVVVYLPVRHHEFVNLDEDVYVSENPNIRHGLTWQSVRWAFTAGWFHDDPNADYWRPLSYLSHALDVELFGLRPAGHHLMNVGIHAAAAVALCLVLQSVTNAPWRCAFVAALFALHPLRVESVAWVVERKDVLSGLLFMLALGAYVRYVRGPFSMSRYLAVLFVFGLALMAKPMVATLPFVLLLLDYWPLGRTRWAKPVTGENVTATPGRLLVEKLPLFALAAVSSIVTSWGLRKGGTMDLTQLPMGVRTANALLSYVSYIGKTFWPTRLAVYYPLHAGLPAVAVIGAGIGLAAVTTAVVWGARRMPWLVTGWFWYLGMLVPVIGLVQGAGESMADRFAYLPLVGLFIMVCWSVPYRAMEWPIFKVIACVVAGAVLAVCAALSRIQVRYWKDSETLFRHALDVTRDNWLAHYNLGQALARAGRIEEALTQVQETLRIEPGYAEAHCSLGLLLAKLGTTQEAMGHWEQALQIKPDYADAHYNLGVALAQVGRVPEAIGQYNQTLQIRPDYAKAHNELGTLLGQEGRTKEAMAHLEEALRLMPELVEAHVNLGNALLDTGALDQAMRQFEEAVRVRPDLAEAYNGLGNVLLRIGKVQEAIGQYEQALRLNPNLTFLHGNLGNALVRAGRTQDAIGQYEQALRLDPDLVAVRSSLGNALQAAGRIQDAIAQYQEVLRTRPEHVEARCNLGNALLKAGQTQDAVRQYEDALRIKPDLAQAHDKLGIALAQLGRVQEAMRHWEQALRVNPDYADAQNNLARLLATLTPAEGGDPDRAVTLAQRACEATGTRVAAYLDTLAAAYAAAGRFNDAISTAEKAVELARSAGQLQVVKEIESRLELYRAGRAYHPPVDSTSSRNP